MKIFFFALLAVNMVVLAMFPLGGKRGGEPMKGHEPFQAEKVKLVSESEMAARKDPEPEKAASPTGAATGDPVCLEWGPIAGNDVGLAKRSLQNLKLWDKTSIRKLEKITGYWVYVPPRNSLLEAQNKTEELKRLGIKDVFVLQGNTPWRHAISLGVFSSEEAAAKHLVQLQEKGVRTAVAGPRSRETDASTFALKNLEPAMAEEIAKLGQEFSGSEVKTADCR